MRTIYGIVKTNKTPVYNVLITSGKNIALSGIDGKFNIETESNELKLLHIKYPTKTIKVLESENYIEVDI